MNKSIEMKKLPISCAHTIEFVAPDCIVRIEAMQNYSKVCISGGREILSNSNIGFFKAYLERYNFITCHKSHVINPNCIIRYHKNGYIEMEDDEKVPLARRRKKEFINVVLRELNISSDNLLM